ncbi:MAG TPA: hypothetical protein VE196_08180 [Pseudonocardiaceae bacterium]|nr:hypothetical protein [Pseudonocardiaceae bacterium]
MTTTTKQVPPPQAAHAQHAERRCTPAPRRGFTARLGATHLASHLATVDRWLERYSLALLRISMGAIIFGFGVLKYFPGLSPAQNLVLSTTRVLTFGLVPAMVPNGVAMVLLATVECGIGLCLLTGRGLRVSIYLTTLWVIGILSPLAVLPGRLFSGPDHAPTLEGQYVLKDLVLLAAVLVIATTVRRTPTPRRRSEHTDRDDQHVS